jgi:hypothetical protein
LALAEKTGASVEAFTVATSVTTTTAARIAWKRLRRMAKAASTSIPSETTFASEGIAISGGGVSPRASEPVLSRAPPFPLSAIRRSSPGRR